MSEGIAFWLCVYFSPAPVYVYAKKILIVESLKLRMKTEMNCDAVESRLYEIKGTDPISDKQNFG